MNDRLLYVMDPMCSWCWGFAPVFDALAAQAQSAGVSLHLVAGGLRPGTAQALDDGTRDYILKHWRAVAERTGQAFDFDAALPEGFVYDTEPASRALVTLRSLAADKVWPLVQAIQQAFYVEGRDVTRPALLVELAEQLGVPRQAFAAAFDSAAQRAATQADFAWAQNLGIAGFPTLLAERNGQLALLTNGYQPLETLAPLLGRWLERRACA
ncbi:DsbA family protein [Pseudomonas sp. MAP12]|uniref:DsbA family protein n=1 Tax=Geopseudomonas aromaticivorans TaxID=2849492 RepID=A0ABS6MRR3_9GAMM|nr:DsbA family protein [Pseudomonas aromaticivorans]MBV2131476.1 DsbA family protein [Pseudomonas aromaticivorans]